MKRVVATGWTEPEVVWYSLDRMSGFEDLENRTVIEWGPGAKMWHQWATLKRDKMVV